MSIPPGPTERPGRSGRSGASPPEGFVAGLFLGGFLFGGFRLDAVPPGPCAKAMEGVDGGVLHMALDTPS